MVNIVYDALMKGLVAVSDYLAQHTLTCLIPAFFIAGAIGAFVKKDAILKYFGPDVKRYLSYGIASISGTVLAVCSCTILPLFAGIYKKGSGIGPATAFLYAGPAINVLAIVYTAQVLGYDLGLARALFAICMSVVIGLIMAALFKKHDEDVRSKTTMMFSSQGGRSFKIDLLFFVLLVAILLAGTGIKEWTYKLSAILMLVIFVSYLLIYYFDRVEVTDWGYETWDLTKKIFPILIAGTFFVGVISYFLPPETFRPYLGGNSILANLFGAVIGAILYMPTLLEVPIIGTTFGYSQGVMGPGPALALLLAGPAVSLPSIAVLYRIMGLKKTAAYIGLVVVFSTAAGIVYGNIVG